MLQVGWISTAVKQEEDELHDAFNHLDRTRVHVIILGNFEGGAYLLTDDPGAKARLMQVLKLQEVPDGFTFRRGVLTQ